MAVVAGGGITNTDWQGKVRAAIVLRYCTQYRKARSMPRLTLSRLATTLALAAATTAQAGTVTVVTSFPKELTQAYKVAFEKAHPGIKLEVLNKNTVQGMAYVRELPAGQRPDVFWASVELLAPAGRLHAGALRHGASRQQRHDPQHLALLRPGRGAGCALGRDHCLPHFSHLTAGAAVARLGGHGLAGGAGHRAGHRLPAAVQGCHGAGHRCAAHQHLGDVHVSLEEAAESLGATKVRTLRRVLVPLMAGGILAGFVTSFITAAVELSATLMLTAAESQAPMSYGIYLYMQSVAGRGPGAALGVLAIAVVAVGTYVSHGVVERTQRRFAPCRHVRLAYGSTEVLKDVDLAIEPGEFFALLGPSGSGKSTLLRLIAGFNRHQSGEVLIDGRDVSAQAPWERNVGMVFQSYALWPHLSVWDNVAFGLVERKVESGLLKKKVGAALELRAILWGTVGAIVVRSAMTVVVVWLLKIPGLLLAGGLLLVWIAYRLLKPQEGEEGHDGPAVTTFWGAMRTIVIADAVMGLDNVLAVAGAAHGSYLLVVLGLLISVPIVVWGSTLVLKVVEKHPGVVYLGAGVLAWTAAKMISAEPMLKPY
ncbi:hypothetical protein B566_EDAN019409, partial [Ephemera danica]